MITKNHICEIKIIDMTDTGEGIGKIDDLVVFVPNAYQGDTVEIKVIKVKKSYCIGKLLKVLIPSDKRRKAPCPYADKCGGCQMQGYDYQGQLAIKEQIVKDAMGRIGQIKDVQVKPIEGSEDELNYRNKAIYPVDRVNDIVEVGLYKKKSHQLVPITGCLVQHEKAMYFPEFLKACILKSNVSIYDELTHKGVLRKIMVRSSSLTDKKMIVIVASTKDACIEQLIQRIKQKDDVVSIYLNINKSHQNNIFSRHYVHVYGEEKIEDAIGDVKFLISPQSFFQVNAKQTKKLYDEVVALADVQEGEVVADLYCGIGTIGIYLAKHSPKLHQLIGIEIVEEAIKDARVNAKRNGLENCTFYTGKAEEVFESVLDKHHRIDTLVVDPPRKGCDEKLIHEVVQVSPKKVIYVSCKPSTLARDLKIFEENGYKVKYVKPYDFFPQTMHVETVVMLEKE